jgi:hypothetical protein
MISTSTVPGACGGGVARIVVLVTECTLAGVPPKLTLRPILKLLQVIFTGPGWKVGGLIPEIFGGGAELSFPG